MNEAPASTTPPHASMLDGQKKTQGTLKDYLTIARFDHSTKHIFILPGAVLAYMLRGVQTGNLLVSIFLGLTTAVSVASANYVINEWLDRDFDKHHPTKSLRCAVLRELKGNLILVEWLLFVTIGLCCAWVSSKTLLLVAGAFALQGIIYNVPPLRAKDKAYLDVVSESINNALRLMIGWAMVDPTTLPPSSIILAYWLGGAFLMAAKRLSEYREIVALHSKNLLIRYRASFAGYTEISLTVSCFVYGLMSSFFLAVFLIKYRMEYLLLIPPVAMLFAQYLALSMQPGSSAQSPEKLYRERSLIGTIILLAVLFLVTTFTDLPMLEVFARQRYISLP